TERFGKLAGAIEGRVRRNESHTGTSRDCSDMRDLTRERVERDLCKVQREPSVANEGHVITAKKDGTQRQEDLSSLASETESEFGDASHDASVGVDRLRHPVYDCCERPTTSVIKRRCPSTDFTRHLIV